MAAAIVSWILERELSCLIKLLGGKSGDSEASPRQSIGESYVTDAEKWISLTPVRAIISLIFEAFMPAPGIMMVFTALSEWPAPADLAAAI